MEFYVSFFIALNVVEAYQKVSVEKSLFCDQSDKNNFPVYRMKLYEKKWNEEGKMKFVIKICSTPFDEKYCADLNKSGWLKYGDCFHDNGVDRLNCDLNNGQTDWLEQVTKSYFRIFTYLNSSLITVTNQFQYPFPTGCYCTNPDDYLPPENSFIVVMGGKDAAHLKVIKPDHMKIGLNTRKYDFRFHRSTWNTERILPAKNTNPLFFDIHNLTKCESYALQVSILPRLLNCKLVNYYFIKRFTFDPDHNCESVLTSSVNLVYAIALPIIIAGLGVIVFTVKRNCATFPGRRSSLDTETTNNPSPAFEQLTKHVGHLYDSIETSHNSEVRSMKAEPV